MSTQQTTKSNSNTGMTFDPGSLSTYQNLIGAGGKNLISQMQNPFGNPMYQLGAAQTQQGAQQLGQQNMNVLGQNQRVSGLTGNAGAGWLGAQRAMTGRSNQSMRSQGNIQNIMQALQRQMTATGMGMSFSPLATGQSSSGQQTQTTSGLGTWLPQLLGAGLQAGLGFATGGASTLAKGAMGAGSGIIPSSFSSSFGGANPIGGLSLPTGLGSNGGMNPFAAASMLPPQ